MTENILDHHLISERYFFPRPSTLSDPFWVDCGDARVACHYHEISPDAKTLVHFHGNGEIVADYLDGFPELIGRLGCNCFLAEYRGYGASSGQPQLGRMLEDVAHILESIGRPATQLVLFGRSVGSLFAIKALESRPDVAGLILESAIADPLERLLLRVHPGELGVTDEVFRESVCSALNIREIMQSYQRPTLIMHTRHDGLVDVSHAEHLAEWCAGPTEFKIFPNGSHNDIMFVNGQEYFSLVQTFLNRL